MASPYIIPRPKRRGRRHRQGHMGALGASRPGPGNGGTPRTEPKPKKSGVPIGAAVVVILGVFVLSNLK